MIELRWFVEEWTEYPEQGLPIKHREPPVLQYREVFDFNGPEISWREIPTVFSEG